MLLIGKEGNCVASGALSQDAKYFEVGKNNIPKLQFSLKISEFKKPDGTKERKWQNCECWFDMAKQFSGLERGDTLIVAGRLKKDDYWTEHGKTGETVYLLVCDAIVIASNGNVFAESESTENQTGESSANSDAEQLPSDEDAPPY